MKKRASRFLNSLMCEIAASQDDASYNDRAKQIEAITPLQKRLAAYAVHGVVGIAPSLSDEIVKWGYHARNMDVIGFGYHTTAVRIGETVYKLNRYSAYLDPADQEKLADQLNEVCSTVQEHMDELAVPQTFAVAANPFGRTDTMVVGRQDYIDGFRPIPAINDIDLARLSAAQKDELRLFAERAQALLTIGLATDVSANNLGFDANGNIRLVDTHPASHYASRSYVRNKTMIDQFAAKLTDAS